MKLSYFVALALSLAACTSTAAQHSAPVPSPPPAPAAAPAAPPPKAEIGQFGLDLAAAKPAVKAGDDFFEHANGTWYDTYSIPDDRSSFGIFTRLDEQSQNRVRDIIEQAAASKPAAGSPEQKIGDYYASFMDEAAIEANGLKPVRAELDRIAAAKSKRDIATLFGAPGYQSTFEIGLGPDLKNPDMYTVGIGQGGLGLPDRDYYLNDDPQLKQIRAKYVEYIAAMFTLADVSDGKARAQRIMDFETAVARVSWPIEDRRDVEKSYNPRTMAQVKEYAKGFEWQAFMDAAELGTRKDVILGELTAVRDIAKVIGT